MDPYEQLRDQAALKRRIAITAARRQYSDDIRQIEALRAKLDVKPVAGRKQKPKSIVEMICDLLPDKPFTFAEIHKALCEAEPGRDFNQQSIRTILPKLELRGMIRRFSKNQAGRVQWTKTGAPVPENPYGARALTDIMEEVLRSRGPLSPQELVVTLQEQGYRADADPRKMVAALKNSVRRYPGRFAVGVDGRWSVALGQN
jgi:hypothetical protein